MKIHDRISPGLASLARDVRDKKPILEAMGLQLVSVTKRAFNDESLRPSGWAPLSRSTILSKTLAGKSLAVLKRNGLLFRSIRVSELSNDKVQVGTDRPYAAYHQFGTRPHVIRAKTAKGLFWPGAKHPVKSVNNPGVPARPFFPFVGGEMTPGARRKIEAVGRAKIASILRKQL
jgi:phage gpG-like protein